MTFLLYIGKNKDFLRKFSKLENVQMIYAQNYQDGHYNLYQTEST